MSRALDKPNGFLCLALLLAASLLAPPARADEPLPVRIDTLIAAKAAADKAPLAARASDEEFLRRIMLDLAGRIPTAAEVREFLSNSAADKRTKLIDRLLDSDEYVSRMTEAFNVLLLERRDGHAEWNRFLKTSFAANKPWDQMVREMLKADESSEESRGSAYFVSKRLENYGQNPVDYPGLTRDVGRLFLGLDLQCAQCHDHPQVDEYKQVDFQGLYVIFLNAFIRADLPFPAVGEKLLVKKQDYQSVFIQQPEMVAPRVPFGMEVMIPVFAKGEEYIVPPDRTTRSLGIPRFSPLRLLADQLPSATNDQFKKNIANRLWFLLMGRGLVDPLDLMHAGNPPSHPELLDLLSEEFAAHGFDIQWMLRELARTETYQRSSRIPEGVEEPSPAAFSVAIEKPLSAEQLLSSILQATGERELLLNKIDDELRAADPKFFDILRANPERLEAARNEKLAAVRAAFVTAFGNEPMDPEIEFTPTVKAALYLSNESTILGWIQKKPGNLVERLLKHDAPQAFADELYLNILSRHPEPAEIEEVQAYLARRADRREQAAANLVWALLASTEFRLNH